MFYHASKTAGITNLTPHISNHGKPLVYLSEKRQNVLVYLSNAVEKHCREVGFEHNKPYKKWGSYGFTKEGILRLEEYYPNAIIDTYKGESGYIYSVENFRYKKQDDIPYAVIAENEVPVTGCEYIPDAYVAILESAERGEIILQKFSENSQYMLEWIEKTIKSEYENSKQHLEYQEFLKAKFDFLKIT